MPAECKHWWIVYFAPSAAAYVTPTLRKYFQLEETAQSHSESPSTLDQARVAAIGPTTETFLRNDLHIRVHAIPQKPTPEEIVSAIINANAN